MSSEKMTLEETSDATGVETQETLTEDQLLLLDIKKHVKKVQLTSENKELRHLQRALRYTFANLRRKLTAPILKSLFETYFPVNHKTQSILFTHLGDGVVAVESPSSEMTNGEIKTPKNIYPEVEFYLGLLCLVFLMDSKQYDVAMSLAHQLEERLSTFNRRTLDPLSSKIYFYLSRSYELTGRFEEIRSKLLALQRTTTLRHNFDTQITLLNLLLRNYLTYNLYDMADKIAEKTDIKEGVASSNELARYYYYLGRIKSVQLNYQGAFYNLQHALRKAPTQGAIGFKATVSKLICIVQLLLGEIPERNLFYQKGLTGILKPYLELTSSVRRGDLAEFQKCVDTYSDLYKKDKNLSLILRMRNTVIMTGLLKINVAYSRIHFKDICEKLKLESVEDAEYIVSKAIRDGIIDATINHTEGYIQSREISDLYATDEPQKKLNQRIQHFLDIHNEAVKAMRYRPDPKKQEDEEEYKRKQKEENDLVNSLVKDDDMDEDDVDFF